MFPLNDRQLLYGTAWKTDRTTECTFRAIENGFRLIDTASQPRSYQEHLVGDAIRSAFVCGILKARNEIWVGSYFSIGLQPYH